MTNRRWVLTVLMVCVSLAPAVACSREQQPQSTRTDHATSSVPPTVTAPAPSPIQVPGTVTSIPAAPTPTVTLTVSGRALTDVQFALDVDQTGDLVFPAKQFVSGVTRIYVRFSYQGLEGVREVKSNWYMNDNPVSKGTLVWDGGVAGDYLIWLEDPNGLANGEWRWELMAGSDYLGGGTLIIGGEAGYINKAWGLSFDPPSNWTKESETADFVTFSSPNQRFALAVRLGPEAPGLSEAAAADLAVFQAEHPAAEAVTTEEVTMSGKKALLQQVRYPDQESGDGTLFLVSAQHGGAVYSLWMLGPVDDAADLRRLLFETLRSVRFSADD